jgi:hypothetical protein
LFWRAKGFAGLGADEPVGIGAGFDDGAVEGQPVHDRGAQARVRERLGPAGERLVRRDREGVRFLPLGQDLEEESGPPALVLDFPGTDAVVEFVQE